MRLPFTKNRERFSDTDSEQSGDGPDGYVGLLKRRLEVARQAKSSRIGKWSEVMAFFLGDQDRVWDEANNRLIRVDYTESGLKYFVSENQFPMITDTATHKLIRSINMPRALPKSSDPNDEVAKKAGTDVLASWWHSSKMQSVLWEAYAMCVSFGTSFLYDYWDPNIKRYIRAGDGSVEAVVGDACVEALSPFDVYPQPCERWDDVQWCIIARSRDLSWFKQAFGEAADGLKPDGDNIDRSIVPGYNPFGNSSQDRDRATLYEMLEKPTKDYPDGRTIMIAGDKVMWYEPDIGTRQKTLPIVILPFRVIPHTLWTIGLLEVLLPQQRELNFALSNIAENMRLHRSPKWLVPASARVAANTITNASEQAITFYGAMYPKPADPPQLPSWVQGYADSIRQSMETLSGQHEMSQGAVPPGVTAASAMSILKQADNERLAVAANLGRDAVEELCTRILDRIVENYDEERLVGLVGDSNTESIRYLRGSDIGFRDVRVDISEGVEDSDSARSQQLFDYMQMGLHSLPVEFQVEFLTGVRQQWLADAVVAAQGKLTANMEQQQMMSGMDPAMVQGEMVGTE